MSGLLLLVACGSKQRNPNVCCTTQADCEALGVDPAEFQCDDGFVCIANACVEPAACDAPSDCPTTTPHCADGTCAECIDDAHCGDRVCNPATNACVECVDSSDCNNQVCEASTNTCRACTAHTECESGYCEMGGTCQGDTIVPRFVPDACDIPTSQELVLAVSTSFNTDSDCNGGVVAQGGGPEICVIRYDRISIAQGVTISVVGTRALAFVANTEVLVQGTLDISADAGRNGPGGGGESGGVPTALFGGGGAGMATPGGAGGAGAVAGGAANAGAAVTLTDVLRGGAEAAARGGGGGGAATLIACRGVVSVSGLIDAGGGGGSGGNSTDGGGGYGGGTGGRVVLQGMRIEVIGQMFANGGGGGAGTDSAARGQDGSRSLTPAAGGIGTNGAGSGGAGGVVAVPPADGQGASSPRSPGGGGGSIGFFQSFTPEGVAPTITPQASSPAFQSNGTLPTR